MTMNNHTAVVEHIRQYAQTVGFINVQIASSRLPAERVPKLNQWLHAQIALTTHEWVNYGQCADEDIVSQAKSIILFALPYWSEPFKKTWQVLKNPDKAYISRVAIGQNPNLVLNEKLNRVGKFIHTKVPDSFCYELSVTAPVSIVAIAEQAGLGWKGKNTLLLQKEAGSMVFLTALLTNISLPSDPPVTNLCGSCTLCIDACPSQALKPYQIDSSRCISHWTRATPELTELSVRKAVGNRVYGCDNCQLICPFNRDRASVQAQAFKPQHSLDDISLLDLLGWQEQDFNEKMADSPIFRIGYTKWLSNIIIALGNATKNKHIAFLLLPLLNRQQMEIQEAARWSIKQHND